MTKFYFMDVAFFVLLMGYFESSDGTLLRISNYTKEIYSSCTSLSSFLNGKDKYVYSATVNTTSIDVSKRQVVLFEIQKHPSSFESVCVLNIFLYNCSSSYVNKTCYCKSSSNSVLEIVYNATADIIYSNGAIRLSWPYDNIGGANYSNTVLVPTVYYDPVFDLKQNNIPINLEKCIIPFSSLVEIQWCVSGLSPSYILQISNISSNNNCIRNNFTYNYWTDFTVSFMEIDGCQRNQSYNCYLTVNDTTITSETPTEVSSTITGTPLHVQETTDSLICSDAGKGVFIADVICTLFVIILSIIAIMILFKTDNCDTYLILLYVLVTISEIAQIILVIVAATIIDCNMDSSIPFWIIMIIYQCLVNFILIVVDFTLLGIKKNCVKSRQTTHLLKFLVAQLCVHTVIGVIVLPFFIFFVWTKGSVDITENHSMKDDPVHSKPAHGAATGSENKKPVTAPTVTLSPDEVNSPNLLVKNNQELYLQDKSTTIDNEKIHETITKQNKKSTSNKNRSKPVNSVGKESTSTTERIETASDITIDVEDSSNENKKVSTVAGINTNLWADNRPPSIEITSNPLRELPPLRKQKYSMN